MKAILCAIVLMASFSIASDECADQVQLNGCKEKLDLAFLIDTSSSWCDEEIDSENCNSIWSAKQLALDLIENRGFDELQTALLVFSTANKILYNYGEAVGTQENLNLFEERFEILRGATFTSRAMETYLEEMHSTRISEVPTHLVVITDGRPSLGQSPCSGVEQLQEALGDGDRLTIILAGETDAFSEFECLLENERNNVDILEVNRLSEICISDECRTSPVFAPTSVPAIEGPSTFTLTILEVVDCNQDKVSMSEIWFYDSDGQVITWDTVSVHEGNSPGNERPMNLYDQNVVSKWLDFGMDCTTGKVIQGSLPSYPVSYHFSTANDAPERDPISWKLEVCGTFCVDDEQTQVTPPSGRRAHYPMELIGATWDPTNFPSVSPTEVPETNPPTFDPTASPSQAPAKTFDVTFRFYQVRDCTENLIALSEIYFYDENQNKISWDTIEVVDGNSPGRERPKNLYDEDTGSKWLDRAFECSTNDPMIVRTQVIEIAPVGYTFVTPNDFPERDPTSWDVTVCVDGVCVTNSVQDFAAPNERFGEYGYFPVEQIMTTNMPTENPTSMPTKSPTEACDCCNPVPPTCDFGEAQKIDTVLGSRPECSCCDWICPDPPAPSLDVVCGCVSQYEICERECSVYTNVIPSSDTVCFDAFVSLVCEEGVENSFFGTPYYLYCPTQCPLNCEQYTNVEESLDCLKKHIKVLEYEVSALQSNAGVEKEEAMAYCDAVKDEVNEIVSTGSCSGD